ncbi:MAG: group II truncated hemoglobin [Methylococcales bacterium]|nr:group II truncated hemoglobin [Methylococcales bacterium]
MTTEQPTFYALIGGEKTILQLVTRFYFHMDSLPETTALRAIHAEDLTETRQKLFKFLSGWLGGPDLFVQEYGHPRLRRRHFPFAIGESERDQWMLCMNHALSDSGMTNELQLSLKQALQQLATHMINKNE